MADTRYQSILRAACALCAMPDPDSERARTDQLDEERKQREEKESASDQGAYLGKITFSKIKIKDQDLFSDFDQIF